MTGSTARTGACIAAAAASLLLAQPAGAASPACREWRAEHGEWKTEVVRRYLTGAAQRALDTAVFELLQREAYLTACDVSVEGARGELVGWRLVDLGPDDYAGAVLASVLEQAGFDPDLRQLFPPSAALSRAPATSPR